MEEKNSAEAQETSSGLALSTITMPSPTGINNVKVQSPYMTRGILCEAYGPAQPFARDYTLVGVYAKVFQGTAPDVDAIYPIGHDASDVICTGGKWNLNQKLSAVATTTAPTAANNKIRIVTVSRKHMGGEKYDIKKIETDGSFKTIQGTCPMTGSIADADGTLKCYGDVSSTLSISSSAADLQIIDPIDRYDDWLLYRIVSAERFPFGRLPAPHAGPVLMLHGWPLRARVAAFAAGNICWRHSVEAADGTVRSGGVVRRAIGDLIPADENFLFRGAPQNSIVVSQPSHVPPYATKVNVLVSESRSNPDYFHLDPEEVVRVQVNFDLRENVRSGQFDLWVKVIDD